MQVALYARVSTHKQEQEATVDSQLRLLQEYAASHGYRVLPEHIFVDNGVSGTRLDRPALDRLRDGARLGEFEAVLILDPDRLARSYPHQWFLVEELQKVNCPLIFLQNPLGDSPQGKLLAQVQGIIAEYERAQILERTRRGKLEKARRGDYLSWAPQTYGYTYIPKRSGLPGGVMVHEEQAAVVHQMFQWLVEEELTIRQITKRLNHLKVPTPTGKNSLWIHSPVRNILKNPVYMGQAYFNKTRGVPAKRPRKRGIQSQSRTFRPQSEWIEMEAPAIISPQLFEKAQAQLQRNQQKASRCYRPGSHRYLLRTLVQCGRCGHHMAGASLKYSYRHCSYSYLYYTCPQNRNPSDVGRITKCPARYVRADRLDALVWQAVCELLESPDAILKEYALWEQAHRGASEQLRSLIEGLVSRQQRYQKQIKRLIDAYQQGVLTLAELAEHKAYLEEKIASLQREMQELEGQQKQTVQWERLVQNIGEFRQLLAANLSELSFEQRQALVQLLVEKVVVTGEEVDIYHILPFEEPPRPVPSREGYDTSCDVTRDTQSEGEFEGPSQPTPTQEKVSTLPSGDFYRLRLKHQNGQTV